MNLEHVKYSNQSAVLRLINNNGAMSRKDIAEAVGLTAASVTLICSELSSVLSLSASMTFPFMSVTLITVTSVSMATQRIFL